jgi:hypothetical protein
MKLLSGAVLFLLLIGSNLQAFDDAGPVKDQPSSWVISGFRDVAGERELEKKFMAVPDPKLAEEHLRILTQGTAHRRLSRGQGDRRIRGPEISRGRTGHRDCRIQSVAQLPGGDRVDMTAPPESRCMARGASTSTTIPIRTIRAS